MKRAFLLVVLALFLFSTEIIAQIGVSVGGPAATQNFDNMGTSTTLPANWRMVKTKNLPVWGNGLLNVDFQASNGSPTSGGTYNWGRTSTERAVGAMAADGFNGPNNLIAYYSNSGTSTILGLTISYDAERYRMNLNDGSVKLLYSLTGSSPWTQVTSGEISSFPPLISSTYLFSNPTIFNKTGISISGLNIAFGESFYLCWQIETGYSTTSQAIGIDNISVTAIGTPMLTAGTLTGFGNVCVGANSINSFTLTGSSLNGSNVTVGPLTGHSFSTSATGPFVNQLTIPYSAPSLNTVVYVRLSPTATQSYNGNIPVSGGSAAQINVATTGLGINTAPATTTGTAGSITKTTATLNGSITDIGCSAVSSYGIEYSTVNGFANGTGTPVASSNLSGGVFSSAISGLSAGTTYYYHSYANNNSGANYGSQQTFNTIAAPVVNATPATSVSAYSFTANWNSAAGVTNYRLDVAEAQDFSEGFVPGYQNKMANGTSLPVIGVSPAATYYYRVRTYDGEVTGPNSNVINVTTPWGVPLPATIIQLSGIRKNNKNTFTWGTTAETNNKGFELQRSSDGITFRTITFIESLAPTGDSNQPISYTYDDYTYSGVKQYYRLRQVDIDGKSKLSNVIMIRDEEIKKMELQLYPNPATTSINVQIDSPVKDRLTYYISDRSGIQIKQGVYEVLEGSNSISIFTSGFSPGFYYLQVTNREGMCLSRSFFIQ